MKWFEDLKIRTKITVGFGLLIVLMALMAVFAVTELSLTEEEYNNVLTYPVEARGAMQNFNTFYHEFERLVATAAAYSGDNNQTEIEALYNEALSVYGMTLGCLQKYKEIYHANPSLSQAEIASRDKQNGILRDMVNEYKENTLERVVSAARANDYKNAVNVLNENKDALENIRLSAGNIVDNITSFAEQNIYTAEKNASNARTLLLIIAALTVLSAGALSVLIASFISKPINRLVDAAENVARGNLGVNFAAPAKDETGKLIGSFSRVVSTINSLIKDIGQVAANQAAGGIDNLSIDGSVYEGEFNRITEILNKTVASMNGDSSYAIDRIRDIGDGNFNFEVRKMPGQKVILTHSLQETKDNLIKFNSDINSLINGASSGNLDTSVDISAYKGGWRAMAGRLNALMDTISAPVNEVMSVMSDISHGSFEHRIAGEYQGGFLTLKQSVNSTVTNIASYIDEIASVLKSLSQNDLNQGISREYVGRFSAVKDAMNNIISTFNSVIGGISNAAEQVASGSRSISESSMSLASGATEQASSVEELNATILTINESSLSNAENAESAEKLSDTFRDTASKGDGDMRDMLSAMEGIKDSSGKISRIIKVIEDIAFQTNLLALNAAVEAARAGDHGKGFAVVAEEVRTLASRSRTAAKETAELIEESIIRVDEGTKIADETALALKMIVSGADRIAGIISGISRAANEQADAIKQVSEGIDQISKVVQDNSATSEESAAASQELSSQAEIMRSLAGVFRLKTSG